MKWLTFAMTTSTAFVAITIIGFVVIQLDIWLNGAWLQAVANSNSGIIFSGHYWVILYLRGSWWWLFPGAVTSVLLSIFNFWANK